MIEWNTSEKTQTSNKVCRSLPESVWHSINEKKESKTVFNGCFQRDPLNIAKSLKRPSAPNTGPKVTWPKGISDLDFPSKQGCKIAYSKSLGEITFTRC